MTFERQPCRPQQTSHNDEDAQEPQQVKCAQALNVNLVNQGDDAAHARHVGTDFPFEADESHHKHGDCRAHHEHHKPLRRVVIEQIVSRHRIAHGGEQIGNEALLTLIHMQVLDDFEVSEHTQENERQNASDAHAHQQHGHTRAIGQQAQHRHPKCQKHAIGGHQQRAERGGEEISRSSDKSIDGISFH